MQNRKDLLQAHRLMTQRSALALICGEPDSPNQPLRRLNLGTISSLLVGAIAVGAGTLLLRGGMGARWARWVVVAWLAFHVVVGTLDSWREAAPHMVLLIVIAYFLFGSPTAVYFRRNGPLVI